MLGTRYSEKYLWTFHVRDKMRYYRLTEARIKRIIRHPARVEEGILEGAVACMSPSGGSLSLREISRRDDRGRQPVLSKKYSEIWVMYVLLKVRGTKRIKIITAWRYPGKSPERDPVPAKILKEIRDII